MQNTPSCSSSSCVSRVSASAPRHDAERGGGQRGAAISRGYQRLLSKHRMNVQRDRASSGDDPQQRHGGDVLRDVVRDRQQQHAARRREAAPQQAARQRGRRGTRLRRGICDRPSTVDTARRPAHASGGRAEHDEDAVADGPVDAPACASGSTARSGTDSRASASSDARLDSANSRYGLRPDSVSKTTPAAADWSSTAGSTAGRA